MMRCLLSHSSLVPPAAPANGFALFCGRFCIVWMVPACRLAIDMMILGTNFWPLVVVSCGYGGSGSDPSLAAFIHAVTVCMFCSRNWQQLTIAPKWPCSNACSPLQILLLLPWLLLLLLLLLLMLLLLLLLLGCHYPAAHGTKKNCRVAAAFWPSSVGHLRR